MCEVATGSAMADGSPSVLVSVGIAPRFSSMQRGRIRLSGYNTTAAYSHKWNSLPGSGKLWGGVRQGDQSPKPIACLEADGHAQLPAIRRGTTSPSLPSSQTRRDLE